MKSYISLCLPDRLGSEDEDVALSVRYSVVKGHGHEKHQNALRWCFGIWHCVCIPNFGLPLFATGSRSDRTLLTLQETECSGVTYLLKDLPGREYWLKLVHYPNNHWLDTIEIHWIRMTHLNTFESIDLELGLYMLHPDCDGLWKQLCCQTRFINRPKWQSDSCIAWCWSAIWISMTRDLSGARTELPSSSRMSCRPTSGIV